MQSESILFSSFEIIALCGNPGSGKSTLAKYLRDNFGLTIVSGSSILKSEAEQKGLFLKSRRYFDQFHRIWRRRNCIDAMARYILGLPIRSMGGVCFENLRNKHDAYTLKANGALIVALWCPVEERFQRIQSLRSSKHPTSLNEFKAAEALEYASLDAYGSHVLEVMRMADLHIDARPSTDLLVKNLRNTPAIPKLLPAS